MVEFDEDKIVEYPKVALVEDVDGYEAIMAGLAAVMEHVGESCANQGYFVPEVSLCSEALHAGLDILRPHAIGILKAAEVELDLALPKDVVIHFEKVEDSSQNDE